MKIEINWLLLLFTFAVMTVTWVTLGLLDDFLETNNREFILLVMYGISWYESIRDE
jgi:hypothetical protein